MGKIVYLNGAYLPLERASVSVEDRGFLFGDGVYEVVRYYNGHPIGMRMHVDRLRRSLELIRLPLPLGPEEDGPDFAAISDELIRRNDCPDGYVYWQVTRGAAPRSHTFPGSDTPPTVYAMADTAPALRPDTAPAKLRAITRHDARWERNEIKSTSLLANVLDAQAAADAGCDEAILHRAGVVTEGTRRSVLVVIDGEIRTYPLDGRILDSITRRIALELAAEAGYAVRETPCELAALPRAEEVIAVGSTTDIAAVTHVDGEAIGDGEAGPVASALFDRYKAYVFERCGQPA